MVLSLLPLGVLPDRDHMLMLSSLFGDTWIWKCIDLKPLCFLRDVFTTQIPGKDMQISLCPWCCWLDPSSPPRRLCLEGHQLSGTLVTWTGSLGAVPSLSLLPFTPGVFLSKWLQHFKRCSLFLNQHLWCLIAGGVTFYLVHHVSRNRNQKNIFLFFRMCTSTSLKKMYVNLAKLVQYRSRKGMSHTFLEHAYNLSWRQGIWFVYQLASNHFGTASLLKLWTSS